MKDLTVEAIWNMSESELTSYLEQSQPKEVSARIRFYAPGFMYYRNSRYKSSTNEFPTISVTGNSCSLRCKHCGGKVLESMYSATTPDELFKVASRLRRKGSTGCLISGGCMPDGSVPLKRFIGSIERIKKELGLRVFVHTGIIDSSTAERLKKADVDAALIDIIGDKETIKEVYNLSLSPASFVRSVKALEKSGVPFVPHVIVGLHHGKIKGELDALKAISNNSPSAVVIIAFMPIHGTLMETDKPPKPVDIARVLLAAKTMFPKVPVVLGCMRPKGRHRVQTDTFAVKAWVDAIAFPAEEAIQIAEDLGLQLSFSPTCCAQVFSDIKLDNIH